MHHGLRGDGRPWVALSINEIDIDDCYAVTVSPARANIVGPYLSYLA